MYERTVEVPIKDYIYEKVRMLTKDFKITLTESEIDHFYTLTTETAVDNYAHDFFKRLKWK